MISCANVIKLLYPAVEEQYRSANGHYDTEVNPLVSKLTSECQVYIRCLEMLGHRVSIALNNWHGDNRIVSIRLDGRKMYDDGRWTNSFWKRFPDADGASEDVVRQRATDLDKAIFIIELCKAVDKETALELYRKADQAYIDSVADASESSCPLQADAKVSVEDVVNRLYYAFESVYRVTDLIVKDGTISPVLTGELEGYRKVLALMGHEFNVALSSAEYGNHILELALDGVLLFDGKLWTSAFREQYPKAKWGPERVMSNT